jgi:hypothetical protein
MRKIPNELRSQKRNASRSLPVTAWSAHGDCIHLSCSFTLPGKERQTFANFSHNFHPNLT